MRRALLLLALALAACDTADPPPAPDGLFDGAAFLSDADGLAGNWAWTRPGMRCRDGSPTGAMVRPAPGSRELLILLQGGGTCATPETCGRNRAAFSRADAAAFVDRLDGNAVFADRADNPFAGWNVVVVPYCTGDLHAGTRDAAVPGVDGTQRFAGAANLDAVLGQIGPAARQAATVVLAGVSAGGIGATLSVGRAASALAPAPVHLVADGGPIPLDSAAFAPALQRRWVDLWGLALPAGCLDCDPDRGPGLGAVLPFWTRRYPDRRFGVVAFQNDVALRALYGAVGPECADTRGASCRLAPAAYAAGLQSVRDALPTDAAALFVPPGEGHTSLLSPDLFDRTAGGAALTDWLRALATGGPLPEVGAPTP
ncbi:pectin acetylesterase-family hydrolase [Rubrivirga sp. IMCC45206]|uniref:pectin acetylesterase-family hydrolase n=1 Tax=Rubrivirga sp. IMCC45206 TaxID=3391614 RepID=UPI00398FE9FC